MAAGWRRNGVSELRGRPLPPVTPLLPSLTTLSFSLLLSPSLSLPLALSLSLSLSLSFSPRPPTSPSLFLLLSPSPCRLYFLGGPDRTLPAVRIAHACHACHGAAHSSRVSLLTKGWIARSRDAARDDPDDTLCRRVACRGSHTAARPAP